MKVLKGKTHYRKHDLKQLRGSGSYQFIDRGIASHHAKLSIRQWGGGDYPPSPPLQEQQKTSENRQHFRGDKSTNNRGKGWRGIKFLPKVGRDWRGKLPSSLPARENNTLSIYLIATSNIEIFLFNTSTDILGINKQNPF